jgi:hypothetical protein
MNCKESETEIEELLTEGLVPARREKLEAHVEMCGECLKYYRAAARRDADGYLKLMDSLRRERFVKGEGETVEVRAVVDKAMEMFTDEEVDSLLLWLKVAFRDRLRMDAEVNKRKLESGE